MMAAAKDLSALAACHAVHELAKLFRKALPKVEKSRRPAAEWRVMALDRARDILHDQAMRDRGQHTEMDPVQLREALEEATRALDTIYAVNLSKGLKPAMESVRKLAHLSAEKARKVLGPDAVSKVR